MRAALGALLAALGRDTRANVLLLAAAALVPLMIVIGSAIDISRYHMVETRLQNACDSGALAARRLMVSDTLTSEARVQGLAFFDQNYPSGSFGLTGLSRDYAARSDGVVTGTASGRLPTSLMRVFGVGSFDVRVRCSAEVNISNTDVMFVLDVTGSMNCPDDGSFCPNSNNNNTEASNARIRGLRAAVMSFFDTVESATSPSAQVRFGIVPYSSGVNVGRSIPAQYMATSATYQTRVPQYTSTTTLVSLTVNSVSNRGTKAYHSTWYNPSGETGVFTLTGCQSRAASSSLRTQDVYVDNSIQQSTVQVISETTSGDLRTRVVTARAQFSEGVPTARWNFLSFTPCYIDLTYNRYYADMTATIVERIGPPTFSTWNYQPYTWTVGPMITGGSVTLPTGNQGANQVHTWDGCIEEAATAQATSFNPLPAGAFDLDINLVPATAAQRWKPTLPGAVYLRTSGGYYTQGTVTTASNLALAPYYCPKAAIPLGEHDRTTVENYLSYNTGFRALGSTYHDIGMVWGARFISPHGLFAASNDAAPNGDPIGRHIVFMTDGELSTNDSVYTPYGIHWWDRRVSASTDNAAVTALHEARFQAICRQAREENISVWVVAFGTSLSQSLVNCATPGRAFSASNGAALAATFQQIAEKIAALRLTS